MKKKHILIAMVGMSPAVLTETVYALYKQKDTPDEVWVVTTQKGKETVQKALWGEQKVWEELQKAVGKKIQFGDARFKLFEDNATTYLNSDVFTSVFVEHIEVKDINAIAAIIIVRIIQIV